MPKKSLHTTATQAKTGHLLEHIEHRVKHALIPYVPQWVHANHLTLSTYFWAILAAAGGYLGRINRYWLLLISLAMIIQWITDMLDGAIGRIRQSGYIKWGYFMDHFADYIFSCALIIAYALYIPNYTLFFPLVLIMSVGAFFISTFLYYGATDIFEMKWGTISPSELKLVSIVVNVVVVIVGKQVVIIGFPIVAIGSLLLLILVIYRLQKRLAHEDMAIKSKLDKLGKNKSHVHLQ